MGMEEWDSVSRWTGLVASIWIQSFAGTTATFPTYSPCLKSVLQYSQIQLNNLGVAKDFGENVGLVAGYFSNKLPAWAILVVASVESFVGYGVIWLVASETITPLPYWQMCAVQFLAANSCTWFNTAILVTTMRNFPHSRGKVVGIVKGFMGLSGAIFTQIYTSFFTEHPASMFAMLSLGPGLVCFLLMIFIQPVPASTSKEDPEEKLNFLFIYAVSLGIAFYILGTTLAEDLLPMGGPFFLRIFTGVMLALLTVPLYIPIKLFLQASLSCGMRPRVESIPLFGENVHQPLLKHGAGESSDARCDMKWGEKGKPDASTIVDGFGPTKGTDIFKPLSSFESDAILENEPSALLAVGEGAVARKNRPRRGEDFKLRQTLVKADFWLLFLIFCCGIGSGVTALNNLGQMGQAQGYRDAATFVALFGIGNFLGRLAGGTVSEQYLRFGWPRTVWMGGAQAVMVFVHILFATAIPGSLYIGSIVLGICYGIHFSVVVPTLSELFGLKHFGKIYNVLTMGDPIATIFLSGFLAGYLYDHEAKRQAGLKSMSWYSRSNTLQSEHLHCTGAHCFRVTFMIMAGICVVGVFLNILLSIRIRPVYKALYASKDLPLVKDSDTSIESIKK